LWRSTRNLLAAELAKDKVLLKAQSDHSIIVIFWATAAIAIAGEEIQVSIGTFDDVTQATKLPVEQTFELVYLTRIVGV
jgi:hypothetical protein